MTKLGDAFLGGGRRTYSYPEAEVFLWKLPYMDARPRKKELRTFFDKWCLRLIKPTGL